jgi:O-antigen/teichoic acid export membrane protein
MFDPLQSLKAEIGRALSWLIFSKQASLSLADQATVSISSFLLTAIIARTGGLDLLGNFSFIAILAVFGATISGSLINAPAMVLFASGKDDESKYRGFLCVASVVVGSTTALFLLGIYAAYRYHSASTSPHADYLVIALFFAVAPIAETLRRTAFARGRALAGLRISLVRSIPPLIILYSVKAYRVEITYIVLLLAVSNLAAIALDVAIEWPKLPDWQFASARARRHWQSSRWLLLSAFFNSGYTDLFTFVTGFVFGDRPLAAIRISQQVMGIVVAGMLTFENTLPREFAYLAQTKSQKAYWSILNWFAALLFLILLLSCGLLWWFGNELILFFFHVGYQNYSLLLLCWALSTACSGARSVYAVSFRATENTRPIFVADACSFFVAISVVFPLLHWLGPLGSGVGMIIANLTGFTALLLSIPRYSTQSPLP